MASIDRVMALAEELKKKKKNPNYQINQSAINVSDLATDMKSGNTEALKNYIESDRSIFDAPVRSLNDEEERSWFRKGAFKDGYDFGDITKTVVGSASDLYKNATKGILNIGETTIDAGAYIAGGVGKAFGNDKFANKMEGFIEKDLIDEDKIANRITNTGSVIGWTNNLLNGDFSSLNPFDDEAEKGKSINTNSVFGDKSDSLTQSAGQLAATFGLQAVGVPWWLTTGTTSFGGEVENALKQDATYEEAGFSGLVNAGAEILTEKLSGGISFGGRTLDAGLKSKLTKGITNKTLNALTQFGIDMAGEGGEELLTEIISNIGRKLSYEDEKTWGEILASEEAVNNYIEAFIGGAVLGGGFNVGRLSSSIQSGRNYDTGLTQNEQSIVDKEVQNRVAELEQDGTKLTNKQKTEIENQVRNDLEKGYISTDTIESTLGGETYNVLKSTRDTKTNLENQIAELESKPNAEITVKEMEQLQSLREQLKSVDTNTLENNLRSEMGQKIKSDTYLQRSYQEKANRSVKFEADVTKYDAKQQAVVQKAIDSGILNNTNRTHDFVDMVAKISADKGIDFDFTNNTKLKESGFAVEGKTVNGYIKDGSIAVNIDSSKALNRVVGHEITHVLEGTELYTELQNAVKQYATTKGEYDSRFSELTKLYKDVKDANVENELTADLVGDYLFTDTDFINNLSVEKPSLFKKVYNEIKHLYDMATAGSKEARELLKVKKAFEKAYQENVKGTKETSVSEVATETVSNVDSLGRELTTEQIEFFKDSKVVDEDGNLLVMYHGTRADFNTFDMNRSGQNYEGDWSAFGRGFYFTPNQEAANEFSSAAIEGNSKNVKEVYLNITKPFYTETNYSETLSNLKEKYNIDDTTLNKGYRLIEFLNQNGYDSTTVLQELGYDGVIDSYNGKIEEAVAFEPNQIKNTDNTKPTLSEDIRYSLSSETDNQGRELTNAQVERFKDSKVRDDKGRLLEVYHGTPYGGFTVFNSSRMGSMDNGGYLGDGFYFTDNYQAAREYSDEYYIEEGERTDEVGKYGNVQIYNVYLDMKNPYFINESDVEYDSNTLSVALETETNYQATNLLKQQGYDGVIYNFEGGTKEYLVFNPNQIKNVTNQNPTNDPDIRYSLSEEGEQIAPSRNDVFGRDIRLEIAPLQEEVKALTETVTELKDAIDMGRNTTEADLPILEQQSSEAFNTLTDEDIAPTIEEVIPEYEPTTIESPLETEGRDIDSVGNRKVKAYQYENPEVRPYFQAEARVMLNDLHNSVKGEKVWTEEFNPATGLFENAYVTGTKRVTTSDIAYLLDNYNYTYAEIEKGLNAIIEDDGKENIAVAKRIEFMLDERLREGYTSIDGTHIPANQEYINLLQGMEQTKQYSEAPIGEAPVEEVAPIVEKASNTNVVEEIAPTRSEVDWNSVEDTSKGKQLKYNEESQIIEEDLVKKTKKELRKALLGTEAQKEFITSALDNAKNRSMALMNNTDTIRNTELVFGREAGKVINEAIFQREIDNEADSIAWQNQERKDIKKLGIKAGSKESAAVQKYGEKQYVNEQDVLVPYGDAELASEFPDVATQEKIKTAAKEIRNKYDNYIERANGVLTKLGFDPIPKRNDYMRHFQELNDVFSRWGLPFNAKNMQEHTLPTDINGLTEFWSPQKNYFANIQPRKGIKTEYDAITGIDGYIGGIANLIYHTEDIQRGRAFEELIRETYGEDKGWENLDNLPDELKQARAEKIQDNHLSNYAAWVHEWTNNVAGKKNKLDRSVEAVFGRKAFSFLDQTRKQVGANMIGFNVSSSLTNLIAPVQALAKTNKLAVVKGTADTIKNIFVKDSFMNNNRFLTSRMGTEMLSQTPWQKVQSAGYVFMKGVDWFSSNQIVRSKYYELRAKGMSEAQAHAEAGKFAARIMGDRTKGANAQIYNSKLLGVVTQFQLEVNNQLYSMFYDTYHESKEVAKSNAARTAAGMTFTLGQLFAFTHLFGQTFEAIAGYNPTFDIIEIIKTALGWGDDDDEEKTTSERLKEAADQLVDALPYVNILTGGGRIPLASALPNLVGVATGAKDQYGNEMTLKDELMKLVYLIPPTGGNQFKKTRQGLSMFDEDLPVSGSYTDSGNLRFPVEDTPLNRLQAGLFGQWSNENAREYFDNERQPLKEKQIEEYIDLDLPIADYWKYRDGLKKQSTLEEKFEYINGLDVTTEQKNIMINNAVDRKEEVDMSNYDDFGSYEEFDFAIKNEEKYNFLQENNISYEEYNASEESREAYNWAFNNPENYVVSKAITNDVVTYRRIASDIYDLKADKDSSGKSISGSRKEKVIDYVNNLDVDYEARLILYKMEYTSDDSANYDIINYLNERDDITYEDMVTILTKLDMTVDKDGIIRW